MVRLRWAGFLNPATWYLTIGVTLLAGSLWAPFATARRNSRVEQRADTIAALLLDSMLEWDFELTPEDAHIALAKFWRHAERQRIYTADLEVVEPALPGTLLTLQNKHYLFHLAPSPCARTEAPSDVAIPAYEVMAWPARQIGPAHSVFFHPSNALPAYTRNLKDKYAGLDKHPRPGCAQRRQALWEWTTSYYGQDDERWIVHARIER